MFNYFLKVSPAADPVASPGSLSQCLTSPANTTEQGWFLISFFFFLLKIQAWDFSHLLLGFLSAVMVLLAGEQQISNQELPKRVQIWGQPEVRRRLSGCYSLSILQFVPQLSPVGKSCSFETHVAIVRPDAVPDSPVFPGNAQCQAALHST